MTATGRSGFGYNEYSDAVKTNLGGSLAAGNYWATMVPVCATCSGRAFNSNTFGLNSVGTQNLNQQFWNSANLGANFTNANNEGTFPAFSAAVYTVVPEPSTMIMLGTGLLAAAGAVRRRLL